MQPDPSATDIAVRLAAAVVAGGVIGFDRSERGRAAGLRTSMLVCLAAALAMVEADLLLSAHGKAADSFAQIDPLRLPLGILTGIGFIGAGAIVRRGELVRGVTTAASIWLTTVVGLCIGGGDLGLAAAGVALAIFVLWALKRLEAVIHHERTAAVMFRMTDDSPDEAQIRRRLAEGGLRVARFAVSRRPGLRQVSCDVTWRPRGDESGPAPAFDEIAAEPGVMRADWAPKD